MLLAWARDRAMGFLNVLGVQGDLPEDGLWEICHIDVTLHLCWGLGEKESGTFGLGISLCYLYVGNRVAKSCGLSEICS